MAYKNIAKGVSLAADHAKYITWLNLDTAGRQQALAASGYAPAKKAKIAREVGAIIPFNSGSSTAVFYNARIISATQNGVGAATGNTLRGLLANYTMNETEIAALAAGSIVLSGIKKYKFASLTLKALVAAATANSPSRITGRQYKKNDYDSVTAHFGKAAPTPGSSTYSSVVALIRAEPEFGSFTAITGNRYRFVPEES
ncbi:MAG: hypothetical protein V7L23_12420 [Nostoc sp.]|uniref:hypothetical protein n=1 Tax=Nostoc sp. TaxID=1180 RepID=UPI002FEE9E11